MNKFIFSFVLALALLLLSGCGNSGDTMPEPMVELMT